MAMIAPSVLSADFARLGQEVREVELAGADWIHYDVMDGSFVPNISMGVPVLKSLRRATGMFLDVHLMIDRPLRYVQAFAQAGADLINVHVEADSQDKLIQALELARSLGKKTGITLKPATPAQAAAPYIHLVDLILVMTVEPGFGGQSFMADQLPKLGELRQMAQDAGREILLEVDGGIASATAPLAVAAGADVLVAGSAVFGAKDRKQAIAALR